MIVLSDKNILVTGGNGFLGSHLIEKLHREKLKYFVPNFKEFDLRSENDVVDLFDKCSPNIVIHLAADCGGIEYNMKNPATILHNNLIMSLNIFQAARKFGTEKIVVIGSFNAYPSNSSIPYNEFELWDGLPEKITSYYGIAKRMNLLIGEAYYKQFGLSSIHVLSTNIYGPGDHFDEEKGHVIPAIIKKIHNAKCKGNNEIELFGDGSQRREFLYVEDAADIILKVIEKIDNYEFFNLGSGCIKSIKDIVDTVSQQMNFSGRINWNKDKPSGVVLKKSNIEKMSRLLGRYNFTAFEIGIKKTIEWYLDS